MTRWEKWNLAGIVAFGVALLSLLLGKDGTYYVVAYGSLAVFVVSYIYVVTHKEDRG